MNDFWQMNVRPAWEKRDWWEEGGELWLVPGIVVREEHVQDLRASAGTDRQFRIGDIAPGWPKDPDAMVCVVHFIDTAPPGFEWLHHGCLKYVEPHEHTEKTLRELCRYVVHMEPPNPYRNPGWWEQEDRRT